MVIRLDYPPNKNIAYVEPRLKKAAKSAILCYNNGAAEIKLDEYLLMHYKTNLKLVCLQLLNDLQFNTDGNATLILTFKTKKYEDIANFITYGNSEYFGSKIFLMALHAPLLL